MRSSGPLLSVSKYPCLLLSVTKRWVDLLGSTIVATADGYIFYSHSPHLAVFKTE